MNEQVGVWIRPDQIIIETIFLKKRFAEYTIITCIFLISLTHFSFSNILIYELLSAHKIVLFLDLA